MSEITMFDTLLQLPLFQGMTQTDFAAILSNTRFDFKKYKAGKTIVKAGDPCSQVIFVLKGDLYAITQEENGLFEFSEVQTGQTVVEVNSLFGLDSTYSSTYKAYTDVQTVSISKTCAVDELFKYEIVRMNFHNMVSARAQVYHKRLWSYVKLKGIEARIINFMALHSETMSGAKHLRITMEDLGGIINETRIAVSHVLNDWQDRDLVVLSRGEITIPAFERLLELSPNHFHP